MSYIAVVRQWRDVAGPAYTKEFTGISMCSKNDDDIHLTMEAGEIRAQQGLPLIRQKMNLPPKTHLSKSS